MSEKTVEKIEDYLGAYGGYKYQQIGVNLGLIKGPYGTMGGGPPSLAGVFGCCGACAMTGMSGAYLTTELHRQEFALVLTAQQRTIYFLPTTAQMRLFKDNKNSVLHMLFELGAKEVHESPNRLHGPNNLHLCVLDMKAPETLEAKKKLFYTHKYKGKYGYDAQMVFPMEIAKRCGLVEGTPEETVPTPASDNNPTFRKQRLAAPLRDAMGRFARRAG